MQIANNYVSQSMVKDLKTTPFDKDSIIFAKVGAALFMERKRIAHSPFLIDNNMMAFQPGTDVNFDYIFAFFQYTKLSSYAQVGALPSLNASEIGEIQIPIPQHEQQKKVAFIAKKLEQEIDNQSAYFAHLNDIKRGILQQMFI